MARLVVTALTIALLAIPLIGSPAAARTFTCNGLEATIVGTNGPDVLKGKPGRDVIVARGGKDKILGRGGRDVICAGRGNDIITGGKGNDRIYGGLGHDTLRGGAGWDRLIGGGGTDACYVMADGGKKTKCEDGDLKVTIKAPETVFGRKRNDYWEVIVHTRNIGATPLKDVELKLHYRSAQVKCEEDPSGTYPMSAKMRYRESSDLVMKLECDAPLGGGSGEVRLTATGTTSSSDPDLSNNVAESSTEVVKP